MLYRDVCFRGSYTLVLHNSLLEVIRKRILQLRAPYGLSIGRQHDVGGANAATWYQNTFLKAENVQTPLVFCIRDFTAREIVT